MRRDSAVVVGIDGGGTVTRVFCADLSGHIRGSATGSGAHPGKNPLAAANVQETIRGALESAGANPRDVCALVAGIAGYNAPSDENWASELTNVPEIRCPRRHVNDAVVAHAGAFGLRPGIIAVSGTGSIVFGVTETGQQVRNYDFKHFPNTSARGIGYDAVFRLLIAEDTADDALLLRSVLESEGVKDRSELRDRARQNHAGDYAEITRRYGDLAPVVTLAAQNGSPLARRVCDSAAESLCVGIRLVGSCFTPDTSEPLAVALIGSVIRSDYMSASVRRQLNTALPGRRYQIAEPLLSPAIGAITLALNDVGVNLTSTLIANLAVP